MKPLNLLLVFIISLFGYPTIGQDCFLSSSQIDFQTPRAKIRHSPSGSFWWDGADGKFLIEDAELSDSPVSAMFAGGFWLGGKDLGGNLKFAGNTYGLSSGKTDWWPGPLDDQGFPIDCAKFDRIWEVKKTDIDAFVSDFEDNGVLDDPIPVQFLIWPGKDNPHAEMNLGFQLPAGQKLAPFVDQNNDGIYDPMEGDYPFTKGAEVAQWWIINDNGNIHTQSNGDPIRAQVSFLAYTFDTDESAPTTIYYDVEITNKATEPIVDLHAGLWIDPDLGCYFDDYIGSNPDKNLVYMYNSDDEDGQAGTGCNGVNTFNNGIPIAGVKILEGVKASDGTDQGLSSFIYYNNASVGGPWPPATTDPATSPEYYNYLTGKFRDGTPITVGGSGYDPSSTDITTYAFSDAPNQVGGWSMCQDQFAAGDYRMILGSGAASLEPGQSTTMAFAAIVTGKVEYPCPDISILEDAADAAQDVYDNLPTSVKTVVPTIDVFISPNPATEFINIKLDSAEKIAALQLINAQGQVVFQKTNINESQYQLLRNDLGAGIYILEVKNEKGNVGVEKVVFTN